jgi:hypothetical protein
MCSLIILQEFITARDMLFWPAKPRHSSISSRSNQRSPGTCNPRPRTVHAKRADVSTLSYYYGGPSTCNTGRKITNDVPRLFGVAFRTRCFAVAAGMRVCSTEAAILGRRDVLAQDPDGLAEKQEIRTAFVELGKLKKDMLKFLLSQKSHFSRSHGAHPKIELQTHSNELSAIQILRSQTASAFRLDNRKQTI